MSDYTVQDHARQQGEALDALVRGCKGILSDGVGFRRGGLGDLSLALSEHVSLSFLLAVDFLKKQSEALRAEGIEIIFHDDEGRDVELKPVDGKAAKATALL
jgi:hypothetical protein